MQDHSNTPETIPYGYCHCGCGEKAPLASRTSPRLGKVKGQPQRFILGHRIMSPTRECKSCNQVLPREAFDKYTLKGKPKGWYPHCRECKAKNDGRHIPRPIGSRGIPRANEDDALGGSCLIELTKGRFAIIDAEDAERVVTGKWSALETPNGNCYAVRYMDNVFTFLHRFIMNAPSDMEVDHINRNGLDCRKSNLRLVTSQQNKWNMGVLSTNKSGYRGVHYSKAVGQWKASISINNVGTTIGYFDDPADAARAYDERLREVAGEYGAYNFPREGEQAA